MVTLNRTRLHEESELVADRAMERYADGDDKAFCHVYECIAPRVYSYLARLLGDRVRAEDLLQQTFLQSHRARASFARGTHVLPWAFSISRHLMLDHRRSEGRRARCLAQATARSERPVLADQLMAAHERADELDRRFARLPASQRQAFLLIHQDGFRFADAAQVLGITVVAVKLRVHRARLALQRTGD